MDEANTNTFLTKIRTFWNSNKKRIWKSFFNHVLFSVLYIISILMGAIAFAPPSNYGIFIAIDLIMYGMIPYLILPLSFLSSYSYVSITSYLLCGDFVDELDNSNNASNKIIFAMNHTILIYVFNNQAVIFENLNRQNNNLKFATVAFFFSFIVLELVSYYENLALKEFPFYEIAIDKYFQEYPGNTKMYDKLNFMQKSNNNLKSNSLFGSPLQMLSFMYTYTYWPIVEVFYKFFTGNNKIVRIECMEKLIKNVGNKILKSCSKQIDFDKLNDKNNLQLKDNEEIVSTDLSPDDSISSENNNDYDEYKTMLPKNLVSKLNNIWNLGSNIEENIGYENIYLLKKTKNIIEEIYGVNMKRNIFTGIAYFLLNIAVCVIYKETHIESFFLISCVLMFFCMVLYNVKYVAVMSFVQFLTISVLSMIDIQFKKDMKPLIHFHKISISGETNQMFNIFCVMILLVYIADSDHGLSLFIPFDNTLGSITTFFYNLGYISEDVVTDVMYSAVQASYCTEKKKVFNIKESGEEDNQPCGIWWHQRLPKLKTIVSEATLKSMSSRGTSVFLWDILYLTENVYLTKGIAVTYRIFSEKEEKEEEKSLTPSCSDILPNSLVSTTFGNAVLRQIEEQYSNVLNILLKYVQDKTEKKNTECLEMFDELALKWKKLEEPSCDINKRFYDSPREKKERSYTVNIPDQLYAQGVKHALTVFNTIEVSSNLFTPKNKKQTGNIFHTHKRSSLKSSALEDSSASPELQHSTPNNTPSKRKKKTLVLLAVTFLFDREERISKPEHHIFRTLASLLLHKEIREHKLERRANKLKHYEEEIREIHSITQRRLSYYAKGFRLTKYLIEKSPDADTVHSYELDDSLELYRIISPGENDYSSYSSFTDKEDYNTDTLQRRHVATLASPYLLDDNKNEPFSTSHTPKIRVSPKDTVDSDREDYTHKQATTIHSSDFPNSDTLVDFVERETNKFFRSEKMSVNYYADFYSRLVWNTCHRGRTVPSYIIDNSITGVYRCTRRPVCMILLFVLMMHVESYPEEMLVEYSTVSEDSVEFVRTRARRESVTLLGGKEILGAQEKENKDKDKENKNKSKSTVVYGEDGTIRITGAFKDESTTQNSCSSLSNTKADEICNHARREFGDVNTNNDYEGRLIRRNIRRRSTGQVVEMLKHLRGERGQSTASRKGNKTWIRVRVVERGRDSIEFSQRDRPTRTRSVDRYYEFYRNIFTTAQTTILSQVKNESTERDLVCAVKSHRDRVINRAPADTMHTQTQSIDKFIIKKINVQPSQLFVSIMSDFIAHVHGTYKFSLYDQGRESVFCFPATSLDPLYEDKYERHVERMREHMSVGVMSVALLSNVYEYKAIKRVLSDCNVSSVLFKEVKDFESYFATSKVIPQLVFADKGLKNCQTLKNLIRQTRVIYVSNTRTEADGVFNLVRPFNRMELLELLEDFFMS